LYCLHVKGGVSGLGICRAGLPVCSILSSLRDEWDALVLENFSLRRLLKVQKMEISQGIAHSETSGALLSKLLRERNEIRDAYLKVCGLSVPLRYDGVAAVEKSNESILGYGGGSCMMLKKLNEVSHLACRNRRASFCSGVERMDCRGE
jgi:hypothetical protein